MLRNMFVTIAAVAVLGLAAVSLGAAQNAGEKAVASKTSDCCMKSAQDGQGCCCCCCDCGDCSKCRKGGKGHGGKKGGKGHGGGMGGCAKQGKGQKDCPAASGRQADAPAEHSGN